MIQEKDVEDWFEASAWWLVDDGYTEVLGRQLILPSGRRLDLLLLTTQAIGRPDREHVFTVVELKKGKVDLSAVEQIVSYVDELNVIMNGYVDTSVRGILCGRETTSRAATMVRQMPHIKTLHWSYTIDIEPLAMMPGDRTQFRGDTRAVWRDVAPGVPAIPKNKIPDEWYPLLQDALMRCEERRPRLPVPMCMTPHRVAGHIRHRMNGHG